MPTVSERLTALKRPAVVMMIGLPGSGKSTLVSEIAGRLGEEVVVVSKDDIRDRLFRAYHPQETIGKRDPRAFEEIPSDEVAGEANRLTADALALGRIIIIDSTGLSRSGNNYRPAAIQGYRGMGALTVAALNFEGSVEEAKAGNNSRRADDGGYVDPGDIERMAEHRAVQPLELDGFDVVIPVNRDSEV